MNKFSIGVDLGGTNLRIAAVDEGGNLLDKVTLGTHLSWGVIASSTRCAAPSKASRRNTGTPAPLLGIGIGVPGIVDIKAACCASRQTCRGGPTIPFAPKSSGG